MTDDPHPPLTINHKVCESVAATDYDANNTVLIH